MTGGEYVGINPSNRQGSAISGKNLVFTDHDDPVALLERKLLPPSGVTLSNRYDEPIRHLQPPMLALAGSLLVVRRHLHTTVADFPCCILFMSRACCHHYPGGIPSCVSRSLR